MAQIRGCESGVWEASEEKTRGKEGKVCGVTLEMADNWVHSKQKDFGRMFADMVNQKCQLSLHLLDWWRESY